MVWLLAGLGAVTAAVLIALVVVLVRHLRGLTAALGELQGELLPVLEEILRSSEEAQGRMARIQERQASLSRDRVRG